MGHRHQLQQVLETFCDHVYFQPPASVQMQYPAIVYKREPTSVRHANNAPYMLTKQYMMTLISRDPDDAIFDKLASLPLCTHDRSYVSDNLNHSVFTIYF